MRRHLLSLSLSHDQAGISLREKAALSPARAGKLLRLLKAGGDVEGALALSTCGRVEVYASGVHLGRLRAAVRGALREIHGQAYEEYAGRLAQRSDLEAARHLFRVAAGLDSPLLGESQVLGQLRSAVRAARAAGALDHTVGGTADRAIAAARRARRASGLGRGAVSVGQAAADAMNALVGGVAGRQVLLVGAGEVGTLAARSLQAAGARLLVASRSGETAVTLSRQVSGQAVALEDADRLLEEVDAAVLAAAADGPVVTRPRLQSAMRARQGRPLLLLDLALPRNVEPAAAAVEGLHLVNVDELSERAAAGLARRRRAAGAAEALLEEDLLGWSEWFRSAGAAPTFAHLAAYAEAIREREVQRTLKGLGGLDPRLQRRIEALSRSLTSKLMLHPVAYVRTHPDDEAAGELLRRIFAEPPA